MSDPLRIDVFDPVGTYSLHLHKDGRYEFTFKPIDGWQVDVASGTVNQDGCSIQQCRFREGFPFEDFKKAALILETIQPKT